MLAVADAYIPAVVIVGRPNVGKSTLFNIIAGQTVAIVEKTPGVTRDRVIRTVNWGDRTFDLIDTGGIGIVDEERLAQDVEKQIMAGIDVADLVIFVVDIDAGPQTIEADIADQLHKSGKTVLLVANKADNPAKEEKRYDFMSLGFGEPLVISAKGRRNLGGLQQQVTGQISPLSSADDQEEDSERPPRLAIIGRRNVGKSSLVNAMAKEERVIVSNIPGTTRDAIDVAISRDGEDYLLIDTAGIVKKNKRKDLEFYGSVRTERSINRADGIMLVLDAAEGVGRIDKLVAGEIVNKYKPCVIVVNKWDLAQIPTGEYTAYLEKNLPGLHFAPVVYASAQEHDHVWAGLRTLASLIDQAGIQLQTAKLNKIIQDALKKRKPPVSASRKPKIYYAVQDGVRPPSFRIFTNDGRLFNKNYRRFIANSIRNDSLISEIPVKIRFVTKPRKEKAK